MTAPADTTDPDGSFGSVPASAWEVQPGDQIEGRTVKAVTDDGTTVTVTFTSGQPRSWPRNAEVRLTRWYDLPPQPEGWVAIDV